MTPVPVTRVLAEPLPAQLPAGDQPTRGRGQLPLGAPADELGPAGRRALVAAVLAAHFGGGWALLQVDAVRQAVIEAAPIMVNLVMAPEPPKPVPPPPPPAQVRPKTAPAPTPVIAAAPTPAPVAPTFVAPEPAPAPAPVAVVTAPAAPTAVVAPVAPAAPAPKVIPASSVRYLVEPKTSVPLLSRRLRESGVVVLRIVVDARGQLKEASVKKSSGFARLDQQALQDIRTARFAPYTENGQAIEWETSAPFAYEVD